jgi:hypothetical protein
MDNVHNILFVIVFLSLEVQRSNDLPDHTKSGSTTLSLQTVGSLKNVEFERKRLWPNWCTITIFFCRVQGKSRDTSVTIVGVPDKIRTDHPQNTSLELYSSISMWRHMRRRQLSCMGGKDESIFSYSSYEARQFGSLLENGLCAGVASDGLTPSTTLFHLHFPPLV